jgi:DNA helicase-2/ATP-dependent DNA helicase PcrA
VSDLTEIPDALRAGLPEELKDAELVGGHIAGADESCRLYGPPGAGKSTQSAFRAGTVAEEKDLRPSDMTVVTYRKALAGVVRKRLIDWGVFEEPDVDPEKADSANPFQYWCTIHAAAARATGFLSDLDMQDDDLTGMVGGKAKRRFCTELDIDYLPPRPWLETRWTVFYDLYTYAKNNLLDVGEWGHIEDTGLSALRSDPAADRRLDAFREKWGTATSFEKIVGEWEAFKREHDIHDFYELLEAAAVGGTPPTRLVVIDEYHDATPLMAAVSERWVEAADTAIVAGDPDQVVNGYAGATPRFFEEIGDRVERNLPVVQLGRSWRCPDEHFEAAVRILRQERSPPTLTTAGPGQLLRHPAPELRHDGDEWRLPDPGTDGGPVSLWQEYGTDLMYLTRTRKQADGVAAALDEEGIVYVSQDDVGGDWELRLTLLRALDTLEGVRPEETTTSTRIGDYGGASGSTAKSPGTYALTVEEARALFRHTHGRYLDADRDDVEEFLQEAEYSDGPDDIPLDALTEYVTDKWWLRYGAGAPSISELTRLADRDREAMRAAWTRYDPPYTLALAEGTRVLTIHASKGAEATDVVVYDGITGRISRDMEERADARENEARTWYVALTRSSKRLHIIRNVFDWTDPHLPPDLEPRAAKAALDAAVAADGGDSDGA